MSDNAERHYVYLPSAGESLEVNEYLQAIKEDEDLSDEELEEFEEIGCETSALDWIQKYRDEDAYLVPTKEEHFVVQNTFFLTKAEAKQHIEANHYHYSKRAHTFAMTAIRAPKVERLWEILSTFDFEKLLPRPEVTNRIITLMDAQNAKGLAKYGTTIDEAKDANYDWLLMAMEELIDLVQYQQKEIMRLERLLNPKEE
ncbi:hypothetical protein D3C75_570820 [compost metagenome]